MLLEGVVLLSTLFLNFVGADRDIVPSAAVCATFPNEEFAIDLSRCQNTCDYYGRTWDCPTSYKPNGDCYCKPDFARLAVDGECVSVKENADCVARLPITRESCNGPNEIFVEFQTMNTCDRNCQTFGCKKDGPSSLKWSPHCECGESKQELTYYVDGYRRLANGTCALISDPKCVAEFQPSPERCAALGQVYAENAPCQQGCYGKPFCPPAGGACVCPPNQLALPHVATYYTLEIVPYNTQYEYLLGHDYAAISCYSQVCPSAKQGYPPGPP